MRREKSCAISDDGAANETQPFADAPRKSRQPLQSTAAPHSVASHGAIRPVFGNRRLRGHPVSLRPADTERALVIASQCVIFVDGLRPSYAGSTADRPSPHVGMARVPFLELLIAEASRRGFSRILLLAIPGASAVIAFAAELDRSRRFRCAIEVLVVPDGYDTAGALRFAASRLEEQFVLLDGQTWFDFNWLDLAVALPSMPTAAAVLALRREPQASHGDVVVLDGERVVSFAPRERDPGRLVSGGVLVCRRTVLEHLSAAASLETGVLHRLALEGRLGGRVYDGFYVDRGVPIEPALAEIAQFRQRPAAFFDRDGVLNVDYGYVHRPPELTWIPGAVEAVKWLNDRGYYVFVITNQAGVARGYFTEDDVRRFHAHLAGELRGAGASIDDFRFCPHHPGATVSSYRAACHWRKPRPGMILDLLQHWPIVIHKSFVIGDKSSDIRAAAAAGIRGYLFSSGNLRDLVQSIDASNSLQAP
jgi:D,D-heptose 1,7-bisphosphate phosphatase